MVACLCSLVLVVCFVFVVLVVLLLADLLFAVIMVEYV